MLRLNSRIDHTMAEWFARLQTFPTYEQQAIREAIKCGIRRDTVAEIPDALLSVDPVLAALWSTMAGEDCMDGADSVIARTPPTPGGRVKCSRACRYRARSIANLHKQEKLHFVTLMKTKELKRHVESITYVLNPCQAVEFARYRSPPASA